MTTPTLTVDPQTPRTTTYPAHARPLWQRVLVTREVAVIVVLVLLLGWANLDVPAFSGPLTLYFLFLNIMPILLIALPMTLVIVSGEIDLSVASVVGLSSVTVGMLHHDAGWSIPLAAVAAVLLGLVCGAFNGFLVAYVGLPSLAVTIGTLALYRGIAVGLLGTKAIVDFPVTWTNLASDHIGSSRYPLVLIPYLVLVVLFVWLLHFSTFGRGLFEIGLNSEAAHFTGIDVRRTKFLVFVLSGVVSALAGVFYTLQYGSARGDNAEGLELAIIAAVLLGGVSIFGGRGALHGVIAAVLLIGVLQSALRLENVTDNITNIIIGVLLVVSVISTTLLAWASGLRPGKTRGLFALGQRRTTVAASENTTER